MHNKSLISLAGIALMSVSLAACGGGDSGSDTQKLSIGSAATPDHPITAAVTQFKKDVEEATDGRVEIVAQLNSVLGSEAEMAEKMQRGTMEMGALSDVSLATIAPGIGVAGLPYVMPDEESVESLYHNGFIGEYVEKQLSDKGITTLCWMHNGFRALSNSKHPVEGPEDVKDLRLRVVPSEPLVDYFERLGATVTPTPIAELLTALQQGVVDGQENGITLTQTFGLGEAQDYMTTTNHAYSGVPFAITTKEWDALSDDDQAAVQKAADSACTLEKERYVEEEDKGREALESGGVKFHDLTPEATDEFREVAKETWAKFHDTFDAEIMDRIDAELAK